MRRKTKVANHKAGRALPAGKYARPLVRLRVRVADRAGEPVLVGRSIAEGGRYACNRLVGAMAGVLLSRRALAHLGEIGAIAGDKADAIAGRAMARHDDGGLEGFELVEARHPSLQARMRGRESQLRPHCDVARVQAPAGV